MQEWHTLPLDKIEADLGTSIRGLSSNSVETIRKKFGSNELPQAKGVSAFHILISQFSSSLIIILLLAMTVSFFLREYVDAYVILAAVAVNVIIGFVQEYRAERALMKLQKIVTFTATVRRDGQERDIPSAELVPGDLVILRTGFRIPADVRLTKVADFQVDESPLTGESDPVTKMTKVLPSAVIVAERKNCAFLGTTAVRGTAEGIVVGTGVDTEIGKIADLMRATPEDDTPLQRRLSSFGRLLGVIVVALSLGLFVFGNSLGYEPRQMFTTSVAVAVAAIPEGLAVIVTVILAIGMQRILKRGSIVRKLIAAETLGSTTVICTDKTGTLTEGVMRVTNVITYDHADQRETVPAGLPTAVQGTSYFLALQIGVIASNASIENPDEALEHRIITGVPTERALLYAASQAGIDQRIIRKSFPRLEEIPFDSARKYMVTLHEHNREHTLYIKGAPEMLIAAAASLERDGKAVAMTPALKHKVEDDYRKYSREGLRLLAVGYRHVDTSYAGIQQRTDVLDGMTLVGFLAMKDPLRADAKSTIEICLRAGIRPVMLTGDHRLTAGAIAAELGLPSTDEHLIEGAKFETLHKDELLDRVKDFSVYARLNPHDKLRIIDALQERGEVVAMTGDGVNDAPALRSADIGIALGSGTDVAKETADLVLLDNNFSTIVNAVREGRVMFQNIQRIVLYLMSNSFAEILMIITSLVIGMIVGERFPLPLLATQILWINLVTEGVPTVALTLEKEEGDVMSEPPIPKSTPVVTRRMWSLIGVISFTTGIVSVLLFVLLYRVTGDLERARTVAFTVLALSSLLYVLSIRSFTVPTFSKPLLKSNPALLASLLLGCGLQAVAIYVPFFQNIFHTVALGSTDLLLIVAGAVTCMAAVEITKLLFLAPRTLRAAA